MNTNLIPSYDMLGLPAPAWLIQALMALTLALHWAFLGATIGGAAMLWLNARRAEADPIPARVNKALVSFLPFCLSMAMTMGIAPLLFVQVLYGNFFYTSNILLGFWWLGLLGLMIVNFYLFYAAQGRVRNDRPLGRFVPGLVLLLFVLAAVLLSSNATLMQTPGAWEDIWARGGNRLYVGERTLAPRVLFVLFGLLSAGGISVALFGRMGMTYDKSADSAAIKSGTGIALPASVLQLVSGAVLLALLPADKRAALTGGPESAFFYVAAAAFAAAVPLIWFGRRSPTLPALLLPGVAVFAGLFAAAFVRDALRRDEIAPYFQLSKMPVHAQWGSFALFATVFVAGIGVVVWLLKLARAPRSATA